MESRENKKEMYFERISTKGNETDFTTHFNAIEEIKKGNRPEYLSQKQYEDSAIEIIEKDFNDMLLFPNINSTMNIVLSLSLQFVITVVVFYLIGYVLNEWSVRKYNKKMDELENKDE